jgi:LysR family glycine cleavage system transcriptional activator
MACKMCGMGEPGLVSDAIPPLLGLHAFEASARHLSFAAAASELHLSPSAISQRVRILERHLGTLLFERRPRSLRLTEAGHAYLPAVRDLFEDLAAATSGLFGDSERSRLTVRVQASYSSTWLAPRLPVFCAAFPHVDVRMVTAIWTDTLPHSEIDLDIRQGTGAWPGFRATKLHDDRAVAVYGPGHLDRHGTAETPALAGRPRVQVLGFDDVWRRMFADTLEDDPGSRMPAAAITVDTSIAALDIVAHSDLWAIVPERFARRDVRSGRVLLADMPSVPMRQGHYLLRRDTAQRTAPGSLAFERWLREEDAADPALDDTATDPDGGADGVP